MSDQPQHLAPVDEREESVETARHKPPPLRTYYHQVRSLLGKRGYEEDKTTSPLEAPATAGSYHLTASHTGDSGAMDNADDFRPGYKSDEHGIPAVDGATDRVNRRWGKPVAAIFIHAGAGYHSTANEEHHLKACSE